MHRIIPLIPFIAATATLQSAPTAIPEPALAPTKAPENFPITLRGFFGKGDKAEISVQDNASGKSVWLKPGASHSGWKLESADTAKGRAVFSQGGRRVTLLLTGGSTQSAVPRYTSVGDCVVHRKFHELGLKKPECQKLWNSIGKESESALRKSHPEYFDKHGDFNRIMPEALVAMGTEMKRRLLAMNTAESESIKPLVIPLIDATEKVFPEDANGKRKMLPPEDDFELRIAETADELYRQRTGGK
jgi:hypothetical protein